MAVKTITIDLEAYETLARLKAAGQSFSQVIKQHLGPRRGRDLRRALAEIDLSDETLDEIENQVVLRRRDLARAPEL